MRIIKLDNKLIGKNIGCDIFDNQKNLLIKKGYEITNKKLNLLKKHNIKQVTIDDSVKESLNDATSSEQREVEIFKLQNISQIIDKITRTHSYSRKQLSGMINSIPFNIVHQINDIYNMSDELRGKESITIKNSQSYIFEHQISVMILSTYIGTQLKYPKNKLLKLANASLIYDFGNFLVDKEILNKKGKLTKLQKLEIKKHVTSGYNFLKKNTSLSFEELLPTLQHHERVDGSGYPKGINGNIMHEFSKIIAIADTYDAMTSDRPYRLSYLQHEVFEYLMASAGTLYDKKIVDIFIKKIKPYPKGTIVKLSNGILGIVFKEKENFPLKPNILPINRNLSKTYLKPGIIELTETNEIVIVDTLEKITKKK